MSEKVKIDAVELKKCISHCKGWQVVVKEDYKLAAGCLGLGMIMISSEFRDSFGFFGALLTVFGAFLTYQVEFWNHLNFCLSPRNFMQLTPRTL
jgi:hypothetical protein